MNGFSDRVGSTNSALVSSPAVSVGIVSIFECKVEGRDECIGPILLAFEMKGAVI
jgi:hypothetical protein